MRRYEVIIIAALVLALTFWTGYVCGRDAAQFEHEIYLDVIEGGQE